MEKIQLTNEKGNVSSKARTELKAFATETLVEMFAAKFGAENVEVTNKGVAVRIGTDFMTEQAIFVTMDPVITMNPVAKETEKKAKAKVETAPVANPFK